MGEHITDSHTSTGSPELVGEDIELESEQADNNEDDQWQDLADSHNEVFSSGVMVLVP